MNYSPKLKTAMVEIKAILKKHNIAGIVLLHTTPRYSEYMVHMDTDYSAVKAGPNGELRMRIKSAELGPVETQRLSEGTYNMLSHFNDLMPPIADVIGRMKLEIERNAETGQGPSTHTSDAELGN